MLLKLNLSKAIFLGLLICHFVQAQVSDKIRINQVGYLPNSRKVAFLVNPTTSVYEFFLKDVGTNQIVFSGNVILHTQGDSASGDNVYILDFSNFSSTGVFYIEIPNLGRSFSFTIKNDVYNEAFYKMMRSYYLQRCGIRVEDGDFIHEICHLQEKNSPYHSSTGQSGTKDVSGGWHDAGNYEKYVSPAAVTCALLLYTYEFFKDKVESFNLNIPESNNGVPDILDEVRYELEWMLKMQRDDGAVHHCVAVDGWSYWPCMPEEHNDTRYVMQVTSVDTADFAAVMAIAARVFKDIDPDFSNKVLQKAELAWQWLEQNSQIVPPGGYKTLIMTDTYEDNNDADERFWAAAELYRTTGKSKYNDYVLANYEKWIPTVNSFFWWKEVHVLGMFAYYFSTHTTASLTVKNKIKEDTLNFINSKINWINSSDNGYRVVLDLTEYYWGSNSIVGNYSVMILFANMMEPNLEYVNVVLEQLDYLFGRNAMNKVYVSGIGSNYVKYHHYAPSICDNVLEPWPGFASGGPNRYGGDQRLYNLISNGVPPAKCFIDDEEETSYASNEPCILYNAPWQFVIAYFLDAQIQENKKPLRPYQVFGTTHGIVGETYTYSVSTIDPDGDELKYLFDWGDGTFTETSFVNSGEVVNASHSWKTLGRYYLRVKAIDIKGANSDWSEPLEIIISSNSISDNPPEIEFNLLSGSTVSGSVDILVNVIDDSGISSVIFYINEQITTICVSSFSTYFVFIYNLDTTAYKEGEINLKVVAIDVLQHSTTHQIVVYINNKEIKKNDPPKVLILFPKENDVVYGIVTLNYTYSDDKNVLKLRLYIDDKYFTDLPMHTSCYYLDTRLLSNGDHILSIVAEDDDFQIGISSIIVKVSNINSVQQHKKNFILVSNSQIDLETYYNNIQEVKIFNSLGKLIRRINSKPFYISKNLLGDKIGFYLCEIIDNSQKIFYCTVTYIK